MTSFFVGVPPAVGAPRLADWGLEDAAPLPLVATLPSRFTTPLPPTALASSAPPFLSLPSPETFPSSLPRAFPSRSDFPFTLGGAGRIPSINGFIFSRSFFRSWSNIWYSRHSREINLRITKVRSAYWGDPLAQGSIQPNAPHSLPAEDGVVLDFILILDGRFRIHFIDHFLKERFHSRAVRVFLFLEALQIIIRHIPQQI
mmetsp:Transcript_19165/g.53798  ORF Transcript_19165/g.53798 Transcript_19165/m.53798 type:complete len:201 (-) Transcript_19165:1245-1847(-)